MGQCQHNQTLIEIPFRAPTDCLQYFTAASGTVRSYNFEGKRMPIASAYLTCIRNVAGACKIHWKQSPGVPDAFVVGARAAGNAISPSDCNDYVQIPGTVTELSVHCGGTFTNGNSQTMFPETVISNVRPFVIQTTRTNVPLNSPGYSLDYTQAGC